MQVALHSHMFHYFIIFLVVLDALIVLTELLLDLGAFGMSGIPLLHIYSHCFNNHGKILNFSSSAQYSIHVYDHTIAY